MRLRPGGHHLRMTGDQSQTGYPEEQPEGVDEGQGSAPQEDAAKPSEADRAPDNEEGTATGNPGAAGADE